MKALAELLVSFLELLEEEGRTLRDRTVRLFLGVVLFFVAGALVIGGLALVVAGVLLLLAPLIGKAASCLTIGGACLFAALLLFSRGSRITRNG